MRVGRRDEALAYFDDPAMRKKAEALIAAHRDEHAWSASARAQALYAQARITRADGLELLGTELAPDNAEWDGSFPPQDLPATSKAVVFVGNGEAARVAASTAQPDARFHYRYVAADLAQQAAALLPPRSQAYAAVMCEATGWMPTPIRSARRRCIATTCATARMSHGRDRVHARNPISRALAAGRKRRYWQRGWLACGWPFVLVGFGGWSLVAWQAASRRVMMPHRR